MDNGGLQVQDRFHSIIFALDQGQQPWHPLTRIILKGSQRIILKPGEVNRANCIGLRKKMHSVDHNLRYQDKKDALLWLDMNQGRTKVGLNRKSCEGHQFGHNSNKIKEFNQLFPKPKPQQFSFRFNQRRDMLPPINIIKIIQQKRMKTHVILKSQFRRRTKSVSQQETKVKKLIHSQSAPTRATVAYKLEHIPETLAMKVDSAISTASMVRRKRKEPTEHLPERALKHNKTIIQHLKHFQMHHIQTYEYQDEVICNDIDDAPIQKSRLTLNSSSQFQLRKSVVGNLHKPKDNAVSRYISRYRTSSENLKYSSSFVTLNTPSPESSPGVMLKSVKCENNYKMHHPVRKHQKTASLQKPSPFIPTQLAKFKNSQSLQITSRKSKQNSFAKSNEMIKLPRI